MDRRNTEADRVSTLVLVGFMAAGKTTVGRLLAERLDWRFLDIDEEIERRTGSSIPAIFGERGESVFRRLERRLMAQLVRERNAVIAPGGGWAVEPGAMERVPAHVRVIWLQVSPEEALRRVRGSGVARPLLAVADPLAEARTLLARREPFYSKADWHVEADRRSPADVVAAIMNLMD